MGAGGGLFTGPLFSVCVVGGGGEVPLLLKPYLQEGSKLLLDITAASLLSTLDLYKILTTEFTVD